MNQTKSFNSGLGTNMRKAARPSGGMVSLNPRRWRGKRHHHDGGGVCWLFVLLWIDSWHHELIVCKKWYKNNPKEGLCGVTFWPTLVCTTPCLIWMWEAVWGGCQPQPWHNHIILTPQVKASPAHLILTVSLVKCLQSMSEVWQSVTWVY